MRREIHLYDRIHEWGNLQEALLRTMRGKRESQAALDFLADHPAGLEAIAERHRRGDGPMGQFREFTIHDPKKRLISAPCFPDRVLHHAMINVCEPVFERWLVSQTYACRPGLGLRAAIREAAKWTTCRRWYLQLDVRHYFETVPRDRLCRRLDRLFGEASMLRLWRDVIDSYDPGVKTGLPIGALTSQHLANFYLGFLDRRIKESLRIRAYARYMDDIVLWHDDKAELLRCRDDILAFAGSELGLELKEPVLNRTSGGMDFLGFRFHPGWTGLTRRSRRRLRLRLRGLALDLAGGAITEEEAQRRATAALAFAAPARTMRMRCLNLRTTGRILLAGEAL
ncbi:MAG: RNA-directed DNA polymerase [Verrucomicrobiales bacterium]